jgi:putative alpha-1,2-mannosidase
MVRPSPDTASSVNTASSWQHFGGYYYHDDQIRVFSHTHMVGAGVEDYGNIGVMPSVLDPATVLSQSFGARQHFSHTNETASPGYYSVLLSPSNIVAEVRSLLLPLPLPLLLPLPLPLPASMLDKRH